MATSSVEQFTVFPLALGGNSFGWTSSEEESHQVLNAFADQGGDFIDTSDSYSSWVPGNVGGESEQIIGNWVKTRGNRSEMKIATKVAQHPDFRGLAPANIAAAAEASLKRLDTDYIDLYYAHEPDATVPVQESAAAFDALIQAGKVRHLALSNFNAEQIREWMRVVDENDFARPIVLQPKYNLIDRQDYEQNLAGVVAETGLQIAPYFGLAAGFLTGKYRSEADLARGTARVGMAAGYLTNENLAVLDLLEPIAQAHNVSMATIALAWLRSQANVLAPIASARTVEQLPDLMASATLELKPEELTALNESAQVSTSS